MDSAAQASRPALTSSRRTSPKRRPTRARAKAGEAPGPLRGEHVPVVVDGLIEAGRPKMRRVFDVNVFGDITVSLDPVVAINDYRHLLHLALLGRILTELPPFLARVPLERGSLVAVLPDHPLPLQPVRALVADARLLSPLVRRFLDFVATRVPAALDAYAER